MLKTLYTELRQAVSGRGFAAGIIGTVLIIFASSVRDILAAFRAEGLLEYGFHDAFILNALDADGMALALPILAALPYTASFVDDVKSGFVKAYLPRTTMGRYLAAKCSACALSGGLVLALGILAAYAAAALLFSPLEMQLADDMAAPEHFAALVERLPLFFCSGALWATAGLALAALTGSRYMAYASPFVLYYVLVILYERYFDTLYVLYPKEWTAPSEKWVFGNTGVLLFVAELIIIFSLCFYVAAKRRLKQI